MAANNRVIALESTRGAAALERKLVVNESVFYADLEGETVLLDLDSGVYFGLDEVGTVIWNALVAGCSRDEIVSRLLEEFDVESDRVRADVSALISSLEERGLVAPSVEK
jgi:hypothetical protein